MKGFFTGEEIGTKKKATRGRAPSGAPRAKSPRGNVDPCTACGLCKTCTSPKMDVHGNGKRKILVLGEAPGRTEDEQGEQFVGESGELLESKFAEHGINLHEDCWKINAVNCRPPGNRTPTKREVKLCNHRVWEAIKRLQPTHLYLFGGSAVDAIYNGRFAAESISLWRRLCIPDSKANAWVIAMYHPSYLIRNPTDKNLWSTFDRDLTFAVSCLKKNPPTFLDWKPMVKCSTDAGEILAYLNSLIHCDGLTVAVDYETTALQPYHQGSQILSCALAPSPTQSFAFPIAYPGAWKSNELAEIKERLQMLMAARHIAKVCHNWSFEEKWTRQILKTKIMGKRWCTENGAHILDERQDFCGLKFQAFVHFGEEDYGKEFDRYKTGGTYPYNLMHTVPLPKLLLYNGADSLFTRKLFDQQHIPLTREKDRRSFAFQCCMDGLRALDNASERGWCADEFYYNDVDEELAVEIAKVEKRLLKGPEAKRFLEATGRELQLVNQDFSPPDLRELFFKILGFTSTKKTAKAGKEAMDIDVLQEIKHPFAKHLLRRRKLVKLKNTYVAGFRRASINGVMHPSFNLHVARTPRSSCNDPNVQNVPVRDEEAKKFTRSGVKAREKRRLGFADYGSMEVRILACHTKDQALVKYCTDPTTDMHRDEAQNIFLVKREQVSKGLRQGSKNQFIFPEVYGSYWKNCARDLWHQNMDDGKLADGTPLKAHLKEKLFRGMPHNQWQNVFANHVKKVEENFWKKFHATREWQNKSVEEYLRRGYIEMFFGHRRSGYLTRNMIFNTPVQGDAFQCLLWGFKELDQLWIKKKMETLLIGQIHDELVYDLYEPEREEVITDIENMMTKKIRERFDWIIVPLVVEHALTPIDGSWYGKVGYELGGKLPEEKGGE